MKGKKFHSSEFLQLFGYFEFKIECEWFTFTDAYCTIQNRIYEDHRSFELRFTSCWALHLMLESSSSDHLACIGMPPSFPRESSFFLWMSPLESAFFLRPMFSLLVVFIFSPSLPSQGHQHQALKLYFKTSNIRIPVILTMMCFIFTKRFN